MACLEGPRGAAEEARVRVEPEDAVAGRSGMFARELGRDPLEAAL